MTEGEREVLQRVIAQRDEARRSGSAMTEIRALVEQWRRHKRTMSGDAYWEGQKAGYRACADELEARLAEGAREEASIDPRNFPWFGCTGKGRPSCAATECMYGLDASLKPKANTCAFVDQNPHAAEGARAEAPGWPANSPCYQEWCRTAMHCDHWKRCLAECEPKDLAGARDEAPKAVAVLRAIEKYCQMDGTGMHYGFAYNSQLGQQLRRVLAGTRDEAPCGCPGVSSRDPWPNHEPKDCPRDEAPEHEPGSNPRRHMPLRSPTTAEGTRDKARPSEPKPRKFTLCQCGCGFPEGPGGE